jgi:16S rRNA (cytosine967-C5)-methyltransferase
MNNTGEIYAFDIYKHKLGLIEENAKKLGIDIIKTKVADATLPNNLYNDYADKVLVDAPCSGLGLIRKKPEIRWNIKENDIIELKTLQLQILNNASSYVKKNGDLVYSTCTISEEENEQVIEEFLNINHDFELEDIKKYLPDRFNTAEKSNSYVKLFPNVNHCDGFFIAKLKRVR